MKKKSYDVEFHLFVHAYSSEKDTLRVSTDGEDDNAMWLPKRFLKPEGKVVKNQYARIRVPDWLCLKHRQLAGNKIFEMARDLDREWEKQKYAIENSQQPLERKAG